MIIEVEMRAFGKPGEVRRVMVPDEYSNVSEDKLLELVFYYGQNDFQPLNYPSISMGDVVRLGAKKFLCCAVGWQELERSKMS